MSAFVVLCGRNSV